MAQIAAGHRDTSYDELAGLPLGNRSSGLVDDVQVDARDGASDARNDGAPGADRCDDR